MIQVKGATINGANSSSYGDILAINNAGNYEMNTVCSVSGNDVLLKYQMLNLYTPADTVQLVTVPSYHSVTIVDTIKSLPWNSLTATGGIVAIEAADTIYLNSGIDVSGQGFVGGALFNYGPPPTYDCSYLNPVNGYYFSIIGSTYQNGGEKGEGIADFVAGEEAGRGKLANGGGGGNNQNTGGGGGGNYGSGGQGGKSTVLCPNTSLGLGGLGLSSYGYSSAANRIFFGGGGGAGHENNSVGTPGGNGGGIVLLSAPVIVSSGMSILANGRQPYNAALANPYEAGGDGAGGGGAGGTVIINGTVSGSLNVFASGANGGNASYPPASRCGGPGGGGGGGVVWASGPSFPGTIAASAAGGLNGVGSSLNPTCSGNSQSAAGGANGIAQAGYTLPQSATSICSPLPIPELNFFTGALNSSGTVFNWEMNSIDGVDVYKLQSSTDQSSYTTIVTIKNVGSLNLSYNDNRVIDGTIYYRLMLIKQDGTIYYSQIIALTRNTNGSLQFISLGPNPVSDQLAVVLYSKKSTQTAIALYNSYGQIISNLYHQLNPGYNRFAMPITTILPGMYWLKITGNDFSVIKSFIKR